LILAEMKKLALVFLTVMICSASLPQAKNSEMIIGTWVKLDDFGNENILEITDESWSYTYHSPTNKEKTKWELKSYSSPYKFIKKNKIRIDHHPEERQYIFILELTNDKLVIRSSGKKNMEGSKQWT
jgi:hypothetical protein